MTAQPDWDDLDTEKLLGGIRRQLRGLASHAEDEGPWVLPEMREIRDALWVIEVRTVASLRGRDYSWGEIGFALGITAKAAHRRYAHHI